MVTAMNREEIRADIEARHERRTAGVRRVLLSAPDIVSGRDRLRDVIRTLPGVANDPDTLADILFYVDLYVQRRDQLNGQTDMA